ncbi:TonB-dependent receptor family protein [Tellurirhabdus rosea]|uniref:TonB-dependent receptor family protein n=1 Tax=Tellurirhabdus rosea TaxID=2674997 RepID=UPI00225A6940|nr:TonB-dependent receptor family protein [Tellurirhabdus rosea]
MRNLFLLLLAIVGWQAALAQAPARVTIRGTAADSAGAALSEATVMLLTPKDSTLINYGRSNSKGAFEFKNVKKGTYLLKMSFVGYIPFQQEVTTGEDAVLDLGTLKMKPITKELFEVVIKTAKAPLMIKGDTIEYNVSSFKVPPGATVEELLRKLPGVQVDQDGNIKAQGQDVRKVTVDGKQFFGTDPKQATKNLPAEALTKVQVFNDRTEQAKLTGIDDGKKEKTINLELKESFKKGGFGKLTAGAGPMSKVEGSANAPRAEAKGSYNRFNKKEQFSIVGLGNNTNQTGLSWDDYQDFRGSQSFNWSDDPEFGFSNGGRFIIFSDGDDNNSFSIPTSGNRGRGFSSNLAGGSNYNYDTKKTKVSGNYYYNQNRQILDAESERKTILPDNSSFTTNDDNLRSSFNRNHRLTFRLEKNLDSLNTLIFLANGRFGDGIERYSSRQDFLRSDTLTSTTDVSNRNDFNSLAFINTLIFRHKFKKKGRNFAASLSYSFNDTHGDGGQFAKSQFVGVNTGERLLNQNQTTETDSRQSQLKAGLLYVEPLSSKVFWESFYNFSIRYDRVDRDVKDIRASDIPVRNDTLSQYYVNDYLYHRVGTGLRYTYKGMNVSVGAAGQQFTLDGRFAPDQSSTNFRTVGRTFTTIVPNVGFNYDLKNNRWLYMDYTVDVRMPSSRDLQPFLDNSNPRYLREGNPDLLPQLTHRVSSGFSMFNPANFINFFANINYGYNVNQLVYNQIINPQTLVTLTRPGNISGGQSFGTYLNFGFPLKKTKATLNLNSSLNWGENPVFVNAVKNETTSSNYNFGTRLDLTPVDWLTFYANANWNINNVRYSINKTQDQDFYNDRYGGELNLKLPKDLYFNSNFNYQIYRNSNPQFGFDQRIPILNLSVYKIFLKDNRGELRFSVYDVFKRNLGVNQYASQNFSVRESVQTLSRYFMLSFTYNLRGVKAQMRRSGW